ncbi:glycoside hydrolase family 6 protein [Demequina gelatinilytica]|uniref:glycoside hydrolase family 6 protein n=1 Tax=Demequina gelatinilytica TaxID=1638980 RepID=UPI000AAD16CF|nr:glycoside hydrolase family 6 protein [Demequina gelatinilytica]
MRIATRMAAAACALLLLAGCTGDEQPDPGPSATGAPTTGAGVPVSREGHVDNPYEGATMYVNADWTANVLSTAGETTDSFLADDMRALSTQPTGVWLDRIKTIEGTDTVRGLEAHLDDAVRQAANDPDGAPVVVTLVVYDLPGRDCYALASNGELSATTEDMARYRTEYIDAITDILARDEYADLRIVTVIEPDSLPNLVTNADAEACQEAAPYYREGIVYALDTFASLANVYSYLDAAHAGWLGWPDNAGAAAALFAEIAQETQAGFASIDGFVTDTANTTPLEEPFLEAGAQVGGQPVEAASFYQFNPDLDEATWAADLWTRVVAAGFPESTGMVIDTSRNGWGGLDRPTAASTSDDLETYVDESRVDRRGHRGAWCNVAGAGIGERPVASPDGYPDAHLDAFVWVKPPGESDGSSRLVANDQGKGFDQMCDPAYRADRLDGQLTGALPDAPISGAWFPAQFTELVANAYPSVGQGPESTGGATDGATEEPVIDGACAASLTIEQIWTNGYTARVLVTAYADLSTWAVMLPAGTAIRGSDFWNAEHTDGIATPKEWNDDLTAGETADFSYIGEGEPPAEGALECRAE